jgi:hypothetical protein
LPSSPKPDWVYVGTGIVDSHIGEKRIFMDGRPADRYSGVTLIIPFEQSQYNPYPLGPEIGIGWKTLALPPAGLLTSAPVSAFPEQPLQDRDDRFPRGP